MLSGVMNPAFDGVGGRKLNIGTISHIPSIPIPDSLVLPKDVSTSPAVELDTERPVRACIGSINMFSKDEEDTARRELAVCMPSFPKRRSTSDTEPFDGTRCWLFCW